jgi:hypothetical protein
MWNGRDAALPWCGAAVVVGLALVAQGTDASVYEGVARLLGITLLGFCVAMAGLGLLRPALLPPWQVTLGLMGCAVGLMLLTNGQETLGLLAVAAGAIGLGWVMTQYVLARKP